MNKIEYIKSKINDSDQEELKQEIVEWIQEDEGILYENDNALLEFLVSKNLLLPNGFKIISKVEVIDVIIKYRAYFYLYFLNKNLIEKLIVKEDGKYPLENYIEDEYGFSTLIGLIDDISVLLEICEKYDKYSALRDVNINVLMSEYKGKTVLEYLINELNITPSKLVILPNDKEFIKFLYEKKMWKYLKEAFASQFAYEVEPNKTLLEGLIEEGIVLDDIEDICDVELKEKAMKILIKNDKFDYLDKFFYAESLLKDIDENFCAFDYMLEAVKKGKSKKMPSLPGEHKVELYIKYYFKIAKHEMMDYVKLDKFTLLKMFNGKTLLESMINEDKEFTLNHVLDGDLKATPEIAIILNSMGIVPETVDIAPSKQDFAKEYFEKENKKLGIGPLPEDGEILLKKLETLFINDGRSDKDIINVLLQGYRNALIINYDVSILEIKRLVDIKENNRDTFCYLKSKDGSYFRHSDGSIYCADLSAFVILHETGHALHFYLADYKNSSEYEMLTKIAREDKEIEKRVFAYSKEYVKLEEDVLKKFEEDVNKKIIISDIKPEEIIMQKDIIIDNLKKIGIDDNIISENIDIVCTKNAFFEHLKRIWGYEKSDAIMRTEFGGYVSIGDILDAVFEGKFFDQTLVNENGEVIKGTYGHGISYYYGTEQGFGEMIANFATILKSKNYLDNLALLREIIGEPIYNMISNFYYEEILGVEKNMERDGR